MDRGEIPDLTRAPASLLETLENHVASMGNDAAQPPPKPPPPAGVAAPAASTSAAVSAAASASCALTRETRSFSIC